MKREAARSIIPTERIEGAIYLIRGIRVLLDRDLAFLYGVGTRVLIQSVKRNFERFPEDFMFQLTRNELQNWKSQIVISNPNAKMGLRKLPYAFTEQGVAMLSSVLRSPQAININIEIMRSFIRLRQTLVSHSEMSKELTELKTFMLQHSYKNDREFKRIWKAIEKLTNPAIEAKLPIGFNLD